MATTSNGRGPLKPLLELDTAIPDRHPIGITHDGERRVYLLRASEEFSTRERKRISTLLRAIVEFEQSDEEQIEESDYDAYEAALSEVVAIAMPDLPLNVLHNMPYTQHGQIAALLVQLFTQTGREMNPTRTDEATAPTRLRALKERLTSAKPSPVSAVSMADDQVIG